MCKKRENVPAGDQKSCHSLSEDLTVSKWKEALWALSKRAPSMKSPRQWQPSIPHSLFWCSYQTGRPGKCHKYRELEFSKGFYKILDEDSISFSLACSQECPTGHRSLVVHLKTCCDTHGALWMTHPQGENWEFYFWKSEQVLGRLKQWAASYKLCFEWIQVSTH